MHLACRTVIEQKTKKKNKNMSAIFIKSIYSHKTKLYSSHADILTQFDFDLME